MQHSTSSGIAAATADHPYVRFEDMAVQSPVLRVTEVAVSVLSASWLWVAIGLAALWWLTT